MDLFLDFGLWKMIILLGVQGFGGSVGSTIFRDFQPRFLLLRLSIRSHQRCGQQGMEAHGHLVEKGSNNISTFSRLTFWATKESDSDLGTKNLQISFLSKQTSTKNRAWTTTTWPAQPTPSPQPPQHQAVDATSFMRQSETIEATTPEISVARTAVASYFSEVKKSLQVGRVGGWWKVEVLKALGWVKLGDVASRSRNGDIKIKYE